MTADDLTTLQPGDRVYQLWPRLDRTETPECCEVAAVFARDGCPWFRDTRGVLRAVAGWHRSEHDAYAAAVAESAARHAALAAAARRAGVMVPDPAAVAAAVRLRCDYILNLCRGEAEMQGEARAIARLVTPLLRAEGGTDA